MLRNGLLAVASLLVTAAAQASLIGDEVHGELNFGFVDTNFFDEPGGSGSTATVVEGSGPEFSFQASPAAVLAEVDIEAETIWFMQSREGTDSVSLSSWSLWITDLNWLHPGPGTIVDITVEDNYQNNIHADFMGDSIHLMYDGGDLLSSTNPLSVHVHLVVRHGDVPEPATMTLLGLGLAGIALKVRRRLA